VLGLVLAIRARKPFWNGQLFRLFMLGYLGFRLAVEFIKPTYKPWLGLSAIQTTCLIGVIICGASLLRGAIRRPVQPQLAEGSS